MPTDPLLTAARHLLFGGPPARLSRPNAARQLHEVLAEQRRFGGGRDGLWVKADELLDQLRRDRRVSRSAFVLLSQAVRQMRDDPTARATRRWNGALRLCGRLQ